MLGRASQWYSVTNSIRAFAVQISLMEAQYGHKKGELAPPSFNSIAQTSFLGLRRRLEPITAAAPRPSSANVLGSGTGTPPLLEEPPLVDEPPELEPPPDVEVELPDELVEVVEPPLDVDVVEPPEVDEA